MNPDDRWESNPLADDPKSLPYRAVFGLAVMLRTATVHRCIWCCMCATCCYATIAPANFKVVESNHVNSYYAHEQF